MRSVSGQARDPLEWFPFAMLDPLLDSTTLDTGLVLRGSFGGGFLQGRRYLSPLESIESRPGEQLIAG
jgi:hypothetical protein